MSDIFGIPVVVSKALPIRPSPGTWARRYVRHGMADILRWLGEDIGPKPDDETHALLIGRTMHTSAAFHRNLITNPPADRRRPLRDEREAAGRDE